MALPSVLVTVSNQGLSRHLATPAKLDSVDLGLLDYRVTLQGLRISQPDGFSGDPVLNLPEARVKLVLSSLFGSSLTIEEVMITDLSVHVVRDENGDLNVVHLLQPQARDAGTTEARKPVHIKRVSIGNMTIRYTDSALSDESVDITINRVGAVITDLYLDPAGSGGHPLDGRAEMTGYFVQPGMSDAPLGIIVRFGPIDTTQPIPAARAAMRLAGGELQPWQALLPRGLSQAIGGDIIDINVDATISTDALDCSVAVVTPAGDALRLSVGGTPRRPEVEQGGVRGVVADRAKEAGWNTLGNMGDTGGELGRTALSSAAVAGKGAVSTVWGTVTGLVETASTVSKGHIVAGGAGFLGTVRSTVTDAGHMVGDTGASLLAGGARTASAAGGGDRNELWRADTQRRWARSWEQARRSVEESSALSMAR
jgi:hypothetical protein